MNKHAIGLLFLAPMCLSIFACAKKEEKPEEKPFENMVTTNLEEGVDFVNHDGGADRKWVYDDAMWYVNNLDKVPLPDPQVYEEEGTYYIVGTDDSSSCKYIPCYYTTDFVSYQKKNIL